MDPMDPRHWYHTEMGPLVGLAVVSLSATLGCTSTAPDSLRVEEASQSAVGISHHAATPPAAAPFTAFESGQVQPLALSPDKQHLFAVNTPDNRLEIFRIMPDRLIHTASIPVGREPVAVAPRTDREVWVVNHLADSVSVVKLDDDATSGHVECTLLVGDAPRDIVFAGPGRRRAFITTAHRGQNIPFDPQLTVPGGGRADVWVFDTAALGDTVLTIITLFTDTPRALAVTPDGSRVWLPVWNPAA